MKKGLLLIPYLKGYGGTETVINNFLSEYDKRNLDNIKINTYSLGGTKRLNWLKHDNVKIIKYPSVSFIRKLFYLITLPLLILIILLKEKPNFIISTNPIIWSLSKWISKILHIRTKVFSWYHYSYELKPIKKIFLFSSDYYFTISMSGKDELQKLGIGNKKIFVIYNPIIPTNRIIKTTKTHNLFLYIGRIEYNGQKNISELFLAFSKLKTNRWNLLIYGNGPDKDDLVKLSKKLNIYNNVRWCGYKSNILNHINEADALILTSKYEGFSMVIAEAINHGLYVISANCPVGPSDLINKYNGELYNMGDINELKSLIYNVIKGKSIVDLDTSKSMMKKYYIKNYFDNIIDILVKS